MAKLTIAGAAVEIAPYKIGAMRRAAPFIDNINATAGSMSTLAGLVAAADDLIAVLSIGLIKVDSKYTPEFLDDLLGMDDLPAMRACFQELMGSSGLAKGEAPAPVTAAEPEPEASPIDSAGSSTNLSPQE